MGDFFLQNLWEEEPDFAQENHEEDGKDGDYEDEENNFGAQQVVALIDCHPDMFEGPKPFEFSLKLVLELLQNTIEQTVIRKTGKRNRIGLLLYNVKSLREKDRKENGNIRDEDEDDDKMDDEEEEIDGLRDEENEQSEKTFHNLINLEPPGVKQFLFLKKILNKDDYDLEDKFCPSLEEDPDCPPLQKALEEATKMFNNVKLNTKREKNESDNKAIWIFTNQEAPYSDQKARTVETIASDAKQERIDIVVWPLFSTTAATNKFVSPFFESIRTKYSTDSIPDFDLRFQNYKEMEDTLNDIMKDLKKNRRSYYGPLHILRPGIVRSIEEPSIMIEWYSLTQSLKRPGKVYIDDETNRETMKIRTIIEKISGVEVAKFKTKDLDLEERENQKKQPGLRRFRSFFNFAGELCPITQDDTRKILRNSNGGFEPGLTILGFKPRDCIPFYHCVSTTFVIFPNESEVKGSKRAFLKLYRAMIRKNVVAICEVLYRETSQSRLVALYPLKLEEDAPLEDDRRMPPGMYILQLPFEDDIRNVAPDAASTELGLIKKKSGFQNGYVLEQVESTNANGQDEILEGSIASEELVDAAIKLMEKQNLSNKELGYDFDNAALMEFYSYLKSLAFDLPKETISYDTRVDSIQIREHARKEIDDFNSFLPVDVEKLKTTSKKRTRTIVPDDSGIDWKELYYRSEIDTCKIDQLKKYLRSVGLSLSGRKNDLVERVSDSLEQLQRTGNNGVKKEEPALMTI